MSEGPTFDHSARLESAMPGFSSNIMAGHESTVADRDSWHDVCF